MINNNIDPKIDIIIDDLTWAEAEEIEARLINFYGRKDYDQNGCLYNACKHRHHWEGYRHTDESKQKMRDATINRAPSSEETRAKISISCKGKKQPVRSEEWKQKQRSAHVGRIDPESAYIKKSKAQSGQNNPRAKVWKLLKEDGTILEVKSLKTWCREQNIKESALRCTFDKPRFVSGFKIIDWPV